MLEAGADPNVETMPGGNTPAWYAAKCDFRLSYDPSAAATVKVLLAYGADISKKNASGQVRGTHGWRWCASACVGAAKAR
jgi:hypothetical protein